MGDALALLDCLKVGFALADASRTIATCPQYSDILGLPSDQAIGLTMEDVTHPDDIRVNRWLLDQAMDGAGGFTLRKRYVRADGTIQWVENKVTYFGDGAMAPVFLLASCPIKPPASKALERRSADPHAEYIADLARQLAQLAERARLGDAANLLHFASATLTDTWSKKLS